ncbi:MAG: gamma-glutamyltransferase family protein [Pseudomonadota bacterium]
MTGTHGVVSSGHHLASGIGLDVLKRGGNAFDAAAAVGFALTVLMPQQNGLGGEVPILLSRGGSAQIEALSGDAIAPRAATLEYFQNLSVELIPFDGLLPALVPPAPATWLFLLERYGSLRLADVLEPALDLAEHGFPIYDDLSSAIALQAPRFRQEWPSSARKFLLDGRAPRVGEVWKQPALARTFRRLIDAEASRSERRSGLRAAHEAFYFGEIAREIATFSQTTAVLDATGRVHTGLLTLADLESFSARVEPAVSVEYRGVEVHKCGPWTQGPALLQALKLLEGFELSKLGLGSADYFHLILEALKLAYADREFHYGDPSFVSVDTSKLLSNSYANERRQLIDPRRASFELRPGGFPAIRARALAEVERSRIQHPRHGDTTKLEVIDQAGNIVSATPSGGWLKGSPVIEELGFPLGTRGQMFSLSPGHPNVIAPGKRPRTTLTPSIASRAGRAFLAFGSPGGDAQDQWALQFLLAVLDFGLSLQQATEVPTVTSLHWPASFYPRTADPGVVLAESRIPSEVLSALRDRGHDVREVEAFSGGNTLAASIDHERGVFAGAASPRLDPAYAVAW